MLKEPELGRETRLGATSRAERLSAMGFNSREVYSGKPYNRGGQVCCDNGPGAAYSELGQSEILRWSLGKILCRTASLVYG